ncbi:PAS domain-containing sensor histidine kinase [Caballeronia ptereochthonis]|uniref:Multi-sensor signal transduction histidine kinase n=1 Tax=Caballeronia ptereochthonis TaxID=1777144 RepID=A0A158DHI8_9BURK|nr:PAS domain-containing sensor histidine kinase [Caballeronia ptereochthonis]SAK93870.1 multi-sensor signal transduction histidine kinase [Caballeronia ptereochthonis]
MSKNEGRHHAPTNGPSARRAVSHQAIAQAVVAAAALFGVWWAGLQHLFSVCALGEIEQFWLWAGAATSALLLAALILLLSAQRAARALVDRTTLGQKRLDGIIRSTTEAIITVDSTQRIVMFNPMAEKVFRCAASDAIGAPLSRLIPERYRAGHEQQVRHFERTGVSDRRMGASRVLYGLRADGEEFPLEASISQTEDDDGKLLTVILRDVTERVKADAELEQSREELRALSANLQQMREQEKSRIARELHDDLGQTLSALKMEISALETQLDAQTALDESIAAQLQRMLGLIDRNIASLRRIAAHQRPVMLDDLGLPAAIDWLVDDFVQRHRIDVRHDLDTGDLTFNADAATAVFRIVEEALTNIVRHAHASRVDLSLSADDDNCVLRVGDDGIGASALPAASGKSFGLLGVRERANALGGRVLIDSMPENGFVLTVVLPREAVREKESQP